MLHVKILCGFPNLLASKGSGWKCGALFSMAGLKFIAPPAFVACASLAIAASSSPKPHHPPCRTLSSSSSCSLSALPSPSAVSPAGTLLQGARALLWTTVAAGGAMLHPQPPPSRPHAAPSESHDSQNEQGALPELVAEFMVDMKCQGCVSAVRDKLEKLEGINKVDIDLDAQVVRVLGSTSLKSLSMALEETGRKARLIGQGSLEEFLISAAVAEFKGPTIYGVVRFAQVTMELARVEASFTGLSEGPHGWSINEYGDLTQGASSTGHIFHPATNVSDDISRRPLGDLGVLKADINGQAEYAGSKEMLKVADIIGRALVIYKTEDKFVPGIAAAVIARSAGVGENYKKLCTCDGTIIWESTNNDFVKS